MYHCNIFKVPEILPKTITTPEETPVYSSDEEEEEEFELEAEGIAKCIHHQHPSFHLSEHPITFPCFITENESNHPGFNVSHRLKYRIELLIYRLYTGLRRKYFNIIFIIFENKLTQSPLFSVSVKRRTLFIFIHHCLHILWLSYVYQCFVRLLDYQSSKYFCCSMHNGNLYLSQFTVNWNT